GAFLVRSYSPPRIAPSGMGRARIEARGLQQIDPIRKTGERLRGSYEQRTVEISEGSLEASL
ncbi:MAG: hypothetical protein ACE1ZI_06515, partial [Acidobacteriota bacterium]